MSLHQDFGNLLKYNKDYTFKAQTNLEIETHAIYGYVGYA
jgi:hypothetical protein